MKNGFTLIEILVSLVILILVMGAGDIWKLGRGLCS